MNITQTRTFEQQMKKLSMTQQDHLEDIIWQLQIDPTSGKQWKGTLNGYWYVDYEDSQGKKYLFYQFTENQLCLVAVFQISQRI
ncbi:MAG: type II toxin-antitoxin system RelE/ParE family toxin [SAR324 cluster bacterium]|nr:type II toxin-antitoxin system RelE/ParE family toxin [SAR324 cluster bacterium]